jgi:hypothetical protein
MDIRAAWDFVGTIRNPRDRGYAERLLAYYRDYGTKCASAWPWASTPKSPVTERRIANTIRALMVGDCPMPKGT